MDHDVRPKTAPDGEAGTMAALMLAAIREIETLCEIETLSRLAPMPEPTPRPVLTVIEGGRRNG